MSRGSALKADRSFAKLARLCRTTPPCRRRAPSPHTFVPQWFPPAPCQPPRSGLLLTRPGTSILPVTRDDSVDVRDRYRGVERYQTEPTCTGWLRPPGHCATCDGSPRTTCSTPRRPRGSGPDSGLRRFVRLHAGVTHLLHEHGPGGVLDRNGRAVGAVSPRDHQEVGGLGQRQRRVLDGLPSWKCAGERVGRHRRSWPAGHFTSAGFSDCAKNTTLAGGYRAPRINWFKSA